MKIILLHTYSCNAWRKAEKELRDALRELRLQAISYKKVIIKTSKDAQEHNFHSSPQINVEGQNIMPAHQHPPGRHWGRRHLYFWNGDLHEYPPKSLIVEMLRRVYKLKPPKIRHSFL